MTADGQVGRQIGGPHVLYRRERVASRDDFLKKRVLLRLQCHGTPGLVTDSHRDFRSFVAPIDVSQYRRLSRVAGHDLIWCDQVHLVAGGATWYAEPHRVLVALEGDDGIAVGGTAMHHVPLTT